MVANRSHPTNGLYMTEDQYLALDDATDGKYERLNGMVTMLRPPSSLEGTDAGILDMAGGSDAHAALCMRLGVLIGPQLEDLRRDLDRRRSDQSTIQQRVQALESRAGQAVDPGQRRDLEGGTVGLPAGVQDVGVIALDVLGHDRLSEGLVALDLDDPLRHARRVRPAAQLAQPA